MKRSEHFEKICKLIDIQLTNIKKLCAPNAQLSLVVRVPGTEGSEIIFSNDDLEKVGVILIAAGKNNKAQAANGAN